MAPGKKNMRLRVGTSGYAYREWRGSFYPERLQPSRMLEFYAQRLDAVEINNTFYRMPTETLLLGWKAQVPEGFTFVLKAPRRITHDKRLQDASDDLAHLLRMVSALERGAGPLLFQLPPYLRKDAARLRAFVERVPRGWRAAFEFRHASWLDEEVFGILREAGAALVTADTEEGADPRLVATAPYGYLRLRRERYDARALERWLERIAAQPWEEAFVFFKHEEEGAAPRLALELKRLWARRG